MTIKLRELQVPCERDEIVSVVCKRARSDEKFPAQGMVLSEILFPAWGTLLRVLIATPNCQESKSERSQAEVKLVGGTMTTSLSPSARV